MTYLVSLEMAKQHLRVDSDDDFDLNTKILAASGAVLNYITNHSFLDSSEETEVDSSGEIVGVPFPIQAATLIILGMLYKDRDGEGFTDNTSARLGDIILPKTVHFLLDPYRKPICL